MPKEPVTIIGGGIGGLTLANCLLQCDIPFELYEQAPELTEAGAGIGLSAAPIKILDNLGLGNDLRQSAAPVKQVFLPDKNLNIRRKISVTSETICIHRACLIDILKQNLPADRLHLSKKVTAVSASATSTQITFEDGQIISADCTVAADGIHSVIRKTLFPELKIRYIHQTIWRGISGIPLPGRFQNSFLEIWDEGLRFLAIPIDESQTLWLGVKPAPPGGKDNPETIREDLLNLFKNFHPDLKEFIRTSKNVLRNDMGDLGTENRPWFKNRVVFLGDAIHATTPNLAQGGCQAIEDAWCLALCLKKHGQDLQPAFHAYSRLRKPKVMKIVSDSWMFGKAAHSKNPFFHYGFRTLLTRAPEFVLQKQEAFMNDLSYLGQI
jgi:2-polyprenyl-6-methoxyphenol hydroxylase-like FAD-dependent oxidoreductase